MGFAKRVLEADGVVAVDEADAEGGGNEVLGHSDSLLHDVLALDDLGDVLSDCRVGSCVD